jgi:hypothetical protein
MINSKSVVTDSWVNEVAGYGPDYRYSVPIRRCNFFLWGLPGLDGWGLGVLAPTRTRNVSPLLSGQTVLGSHQPPVQWIPRVKRPGREADHSHPTSAEVKNTWIFTSTPLYVMAQCLVNYLSTRTTLGARGSVVVEALCYKPEGCGIASRWSGFFHSGRTMALGSTQYQESSKINLGGKGRPARRADNLAGIC